MIILITENYILIDLKDVLSSFFNFNDETDRKLAILTKLKSKIRRRITTVKNACLLNYIKKTNGIKWKMKHMLINFDTEETRIQFQNIISHELSQCMLNLIVIFALNINFHIFLFE